MHRTLVAALTVTLAACAGSRASAPASPAPSSDVSAQASRTGPTCPMDVPSTTVAATDTAEGEALTFTTTSGQVDELRRRVRALAEMHNQHMAATRNEPATAPSAPAEGTGSAEGDHGHDHAHGGMPPSRATVDDVDNGARVSVVPLDPAQVDQLRAMTRMHATHMQQHGCGMMHGGTPRG